MKLRFTIFILALAAVAGLGAQPRTELTLDGTWEFHRGAPAADAEWQEVTVPHDWAIYGPFDRANDLQTVAIIQNGETEESEKTGDGRAARTSVRDSTAARSPFRIQRANASNCCSTVP